jgi:predicted LPLAT superfamily acyltransferase
MATVPVTEAASGRRRAVWLDVAERGTVAGIWFFVWCSTALGRGVSRLVLRLVVLYYALAHRSLRRVSSGYLARVHGKATFAMVYRHVLRFAEAMLDRAFIVRGKLDHFTVTHQGHEHLQALVRARRGAILLGAHLGSFEAMRIQGDRHGLRINFLGYFKNARMLNSALEKLSPGSNARFIPIEGSSVDFVLRVKERIEAGELVAIMGDRLGPSSAGSESRAATVDFLGGKADLPTGAYVLASLLKCPIVLTFGLYRAPDRYELHCEPFAEEVRLPRSGGSASGGVKGSGEREAALQAYAQRFASRLEHFVRLAPDNWFNFYEFWRQP